MESRRRLLASAGLDGATKVWDVASGREVFALPPDHGRIWTVAWAPDRARLAAGTQDGTIRVVEFDAPGSRTRESSADARTLTSSATCAHFQSRQQAVRSLAWNRSGTRLASGGADGSVKVWDPANGTELLSLEGHGYYVMGLAWSPDGNQIASGGGDMLVKVWDAQTGRKLASLSGHHGWIEALVWSPDGTRLASTGTDNAVRIWDPGTGMETLVLRGAAGMFHGVSWHPDGAKVVAASDDGHIWMWDATRGYERDTTERAWPYIERAVASGKARGDDLFVFAPDGVSAEEICRSRSILRRCDGDRSEANCRIVRLSIATTRRAGRLWRRPAKVRMPRHSTMPPRRACDDRLSNRFEPN